MTSARLLFTFVTLAALAACGDDEPSDGNGALEIIGTYDNSFDGRETITETEWDTGFSVLDIVAFDNADNTLITRGGPMDFSRIAWTEPDGGGSFFYCFETFMEPSADAARTSTATSDASNPSQGGCGMFPWTRLDPA